MNTAFLSLGGNLGNRKLYLEKALSGIEEKCGNVTKTSGVYETQAWGSSSKKKYYNMVVKLLTPLSAKELLSELKEIEKKLGRIRTKNQYADRTIDLDILFFNSEVIIERNLRIPHPRLHERKFVLIPLAEIEGSFVHPLRKKTIDNLLKKCEDPLTVNYLGSLRKPRYICIEGNIGSGKTTLSMALSKKIKARFLAENFEQNNLLPLFYSEPKTYAFPLEYSFLISRYEQISEALKAGSGLIISDFTIFKSLWFAKVNLHKKEFKLFQKHFDALAGQLPQPDAIIYLTTSTSNLMKNINKRGRKYEQHLRSGYLRCLEKEYKKGIPIISNKQMHLNIRKYRGAWDEITLDRIEEFLDKIFVRSR